ncbi:MAG: hypothetical protein HC773_31240, partial [Scytonema sp. CRU_2_7]|nr:hypothetical protein [Scytonema sp. CRU_2_7]
INGGGWFKYYFAGLGATAGFIVGGLSGAATGWSAGMIVGELVEDHVIVKLDTSGLPEES